MENAGKRIESSADVSLQNSTQIYAEITKQQLNCSTVNPLFSLNHCISHLEKTKYDCCKNRSVITLLHLNAQSLRNKLGEIELILHELPVQILMLNEHWLNIGEVNMYTPSNYRLVNYFCIKDKNYGGVSIFLHKDNNFIYSTIDFSNICESEIFEIAGIKIQNFKLIIISLYRTPSSSISAFLDKLEQCHNILKKYSNYKFVIVGDLNVDVLREKSSIFKDFNNMLISLNLTFRNTLPTRNMACLDNILVDKNVIELVCGTIAPSPSDHLGLWMVYYLPAIGMMDNTKDYEITQYRSLNIQNVMKLRDYLSNINFLNIFSNHNVDSLWENFVKEIRTGIQRFCPLKKKETS